MRALRERASYANVMATIAVFVALGGTSYAIATLPRDSVGARQVRDGAIGKTELRKRAVRSRHVRNESLRTEDLSQSARDELRGQTGPPGPPGPTYHAGISSTGAKASGNATSSTPLGTGRVRVGFDRDVSSCHPVATLAAVPGPVSEPPAGRITVRPNEGQVEVRTFDVDGSPRDLPFNIIVAC